MRALVVVAAFILGIGLGGAGVVAYWMFDEPERPPILRDLPTQIAEIGPVFTERLQQQFRPGTSQTSLIARLSSWGFTMNEQEGRLWGSYVTRPTICQESYEVVWQADKDGGVTDLQGNVHVSCL